MVFAELRKPLQVPKDLAHSFPERPAVMSMFQSGKYLDFSHIENVKSVFEHISLYIGLIVYTAAGAKIFQALEHPIEVENLAEIQSLLLYERQSFLRAVFNGSINSVSHRELVHTRLLDYEQTVSFAAKEGLDVSDKRPIYQWTYIQAVFFTATILSTIGYGNIAPVSVAGRLFCIVFSIVGIPFTLSVIADVGQLLAPIFSTAWRKYKDVLRPVVKRIRRVTCPKRRWESRTGEEATLKEDDEDDDEDDDDTVIGLQINFFTAFAGLIFFFAFLAVGSFIFTSSEKWTYLEAFYFCFITVTTIGLGDIVPDIEGEEKTSYMIVCMLYILVGLAFASTIIELVRRQYAESWRRMQEIRAQIQAQLKLAATLRQMADAAGKNNIQLDLGQELEDDLAQLKHNINKYKKGKFGKGLTDIEISDLDWFDANRRRMKAVTILIYESSV